MFVCHSGLPAAALGGDVATTERLLRSWCRTRYWRNGKRHNLIHDVREANNVPNKAEILRLLEKYQNTTELAISTLAGSTKRIGAVMQKGVTPHVPFLHHVDAYLDVHVDICTCAGKLKEHVDVHIDVYGDVHVDVHLDIQSDLVITTSAGLSNLCRYSGMSL